MQGKTGLVRPLVPNLDLASSWSESKATAVNNSNIVVGWKRPNTRNATDQAFYWKDGDQTSTDITISGARSSRALSISDTGLVAGYYDKPIGNSTERRGFVFDITRGRLTDLGQWSFRSQPHGSTSFATSRSTTPGLSPQPMQWDRAPISSVRRSCRRGGRLKAIHATGGSRRVSPRASATPSGWWDFAATRRITLTDSGFVWFGGKTFDSVRR